MGKGNEWLESLRNEKEMTMKQVADTLGISESHYCLIENGQRRPSPELAQSIGDFFDCDWTMFFPVKSKTG